LDINDKDIETIERYVAGLISGDDLIVFERRLEQSPVLLEQLNFVRALRQGAKISVLQDKVELMQQWDLEIDGVGQGDSAVKEAIKRRPTVVRHMPWIKYVAAAAIIIAALFAGQIWMINVEHDRLEKLYVGKELPASDISRIRSSGNAHDDSTLKTKAFNVYDLALIELKQKDYVRGDQYLRESLRLFEEVINAEEDTTIRIFIEAINRIIK